MELTAATISDFVLVILEELRQEPNSSSDKLQVIEELRARQEEPNWIWFVDLISDPIL